MRALLSVTPGAAETLRLETIPTPVAATGQALVRVAACGVNFPDALAIEDRYQVRPPRPFSPGMEVAGVVEAVGEGAHRLKTGDRVMAHVMFGGMAEFCAVPEANCALVPDWLAFEEAAAWPMAHGTAYHGLKDRGGLKAGETLLVLGAAGGVGLAGVQLGKAMGARVVAGVSSQEKAAVALAQGADEAVVYPTTLEPGPAVRELSARFKAACAPHGADVVLDVVGGEYAEAALRACAWGGRLLVVGFPAGIPRPPANLALLKGAAIVGVFWGDFNRRDPEANRRNLDETLALCAASGARPHISWRGPLERAPEAIARLKARQAVGRMVVTPA